jgi:ABC-type glycerol-3-phosphate transport system substrate-binding protein
VVNDAEKGSEEICVSRYSHCSQTLAPERHSLPGVFAMHTNRFLMDILLGLAAFSLALFAVSCDNRESATPLANKAPAGENPEDENLPHSSSTEDTSAKRELLKGEISIEVGTLGAAWQPRSQKWFDSQIESFCEQYPNIQVSSFAISEISRQQIGVEELPAMAENVVGLNSWAGHDAAYLASRDQIVPIDKFLPDKEFRRDDFYESLWEPVTFDGKVWGVPWATQSLVLFCNKKIFQNAGIDSPPENWDQFVDYAEQLTRDTDGDGAVDQWGFAYRNLEQLLMVGMSQVFQKDGQMLTEEGFVLGSETLEALGFLKGLLSSGVAKRSYFQDSEHFAMRIQSVPDALEALDRHDISRYEVAYLPTFGKRAQANAETLYLAVRRSSPEKEAASWEFIKWISRKDAPLPNPLSGFPCRKDVPERNDFNAAVSELCPGLEIAWYSNAHLVSPGPPNLLGRKEAFETLTRHFDEVLRGNADPIQALTRGFEEANACLTVIPPPSQGYHAILR